MCRLCRPKITVWPDAKIKFPLPNTRSSFLIFVSSISGKISLHACTKNPESLGPQWIRLVQTLCRPNFKPAQSAHHHSQDEVNRVFTSIEELNAKISAIPDKIFYNDTSDPYPWAPDHRYWARVLPTVHNKDPNLARTLRFLRLLGATLTTTDSGRLKLNLNTIVWGPNGLFGSPESIEDFKQRWLEPYREAVKEIFREVERRP